MGDRDQDIFKELSVLFLPCNMKESAIDSDSVDSISENCNYDLDKLLHYLGTL